ncbi:MAG TPA: nickel pincer cofactor biosynthesis protein LarC [Gemmatimonadaceae bacterium]|nr:nickel pincer cofactor biosynthesis protein LarC [Gemmatimonadaceae bacterium]
MTIAIFDPFSGISGDMTLGALVGAGLEPDWLRALPGRLGLDNVAVRVAQVVRGEIACTKVDFDIPPQPHGRHLKHIREIVRRADAPERVKDLADQAFTAIAEVEAEVHGTTVDRVHLHEVGAVDAILDIVGAIWGLSELGVSRVYCGVIALGDGSVQTAHGVLPVPAPATLRLLEGQSVRPGPEGSGELVTPTGAALVRVLSEGPPPAHVPLRSGYGAGTKEFKNRPNALRVILAESLDSNVEVEPLEWLATDLDDMSAEHVANASERLREAGALDVTMTAVQMKKGRMGVRLEVLARPADARQLEEIIFATTTTLGLRRTSIERRALRREQRTVDVLGHAVRVKVATLPGGGQRGKPEYEDVQVVSRATGRSLGDVTSLALAAAEQD